MEKFEHLKVRPKYIPIICPVCRGHRTVNWGKQVCPICSGEGYLKVPPEEGEGDARWKK